MYTQFPPISIGLVHLSDQMAQGLCTIQLTRPLYSIHYRQLIDAMDTHAISTLPSIVDIDTLLKEIRTIIGNRGTIELDRNLAYYGVDAFAEGWTNVSTIFAVGKGKSSRHFTLGNDGMLQQLVAFVNS